MARSGFDWLTVDIEHSLVDIATASHMLGAIADAGCTALARVPSNRHDHIKRVLDNGAMGVIVPMVNSRQEAEDAVAACLYPPRGTRSVGGQTHALNFGATAGEYFARADDELLIVLQCEHRQAVERADEIFAVPGIDAIFVGPNDLAASMRTADGTPPDAAAFEAALAQVLAMCRKHKRAAGLHCADSAEAARRLAEGWQFLAIGSELKMMLDGAAATLEPLGRSAGTLARY
jgi:4-hydroxy-2-oxoheptanedioate aldolase